MIKWFFLQFSAATMLMVLQTLDSLERALFKYSQDLQRIKFRDEERGLFSDHVRLGSALVDLCGRADNMLGAIILTHYAVMLVTATCGIFFSTRDCILYTILRRCKMC